MSEPNLRSIACPSCGKQYRWKPDYAGRKVRCACNHVMTMPETDPASAPAQTAPDDEYELADESFSLASSSSSSSSATDAGPKYSADAGRCPSCNQPISPAAVLCIKCGFHLHRGEAMQTHVGAATNQPLAPAAPQAPSIMGPMVPQSAHRLSLAEQSELDGARESRRTDVIIPLILVAAGLLLHMLNAGVLTDVSVYLAFSTATEWQVRAFTLMLSVVSVAFHIPFLLIGIFITAKIFGSAYGPLLIGLLKLAAIAYFITGVRTCVASLLVMRFGFSLWLDSFAELVAFFILASSLFDMDLLEGIVFWLLSFFFPSLLFTMVAVYLFMLL